MKTFFAVMDKQVCYFSTSNTLTACNRKDYFPIVGADLGADAYCSEAKDLNSCRDLGNRCQGAFLDLETDDQESVFIACIGNPGYEDLSGDGSTGKSTNTLVETAPTIGDPIAANCANLDDMYMNVKSITK